MDRVIAGLYITHLKSAPSPKTGKPLAPKTLKKKLTAFTGLWSWLDRNNFITETLSNVWARQYNSVAKLKNPNPPKRALTKQEAQTWFKAAQTSRSKYKQAMQDMLILGWHTGIRAEDLCSLVLEKILEDEERDCFWIHIIGGKTENNERVMPVISEEAKKVLRRRIKGKQRWHTIP